MNLSFPRAVKETEASLKVHVEELRAKLVLNGWEEDAARQIIRKAEVGLL